MMFELWEIESANLIRQFETEDEALAFVRVAMHDHGSGYVASWELAKAWRDRDSETPAIGDALVRYTLSRIPA
jgi:hypothetical protein